MLSICPSRARGGRFALLLALTIPSCSPPSAPAPEGYYRLRPGDPTLVTAHLTGDTLDYVFLDRAPGEDEREVGTIRTETRASAESGRPAVLLITRVTIDGAEAQLDSALVLREGLRPIRETTHAPARTVRYEYAGETVHRTVNTADSSASTEHRYPEPVFHFNQLTALVRSLPLRTGFAALVPIYSQGDDALELDTMRVMGPDSAGVWSVGFADPAIVAVFGIDGRTRRVRSFTRTRRKDEHVARWRLAHP